LDRALEQPGGTRQDPLGALTASADAEAAGSVAPRTAAAGAPAAGAPAAGAILGRAAAVERPWGAEVAESLRARRALLVLAGVLGLVMVLATAWIVADAAVGASPVLPYQPYLTRWLRGVTGERLGYRVFLGCLLAFTVAYAGLIPLARRLPMRAIVGLAAVLYVLVFVGPILLSTDVFSYVAYARMGVLHGLNPYTAWPALVHTDPIYKYVGTDWLDTPTAYGPLYTLFSYPLALLGVVGAIWGMKAVALGACGVMDWLTWRCAKLRGLDPKVALLVVAANPLVVIYSLASAHNDLLMIALMMGAIYLTLKRPLASEGADTSAPLERAVEGPSAAPSTAPYAAPPTGAYAAPSAASALPPHGAVPSGGIVARGRRLDAREAWAGMVVVVATLIKATTAALLPFMILGRRRTSVVAGVAAALVVGLAAAYAAFGIHGMDIVSALNRDSAYVSTDSFATEFAHLLGKPGVFPVDHVLLKGLLVVIGVYLVWRTWRGYDWIAGAGWALAAITVTSTWLLAWYLIWPLPIAAISRDRRLLWATLLIETLFIVHQISPLFTPQV
jgi:hypothetical protein